MRVPRPAAGDRRTREITNTSGTWCLPPFVFVISRVRPPREARLAELAAGRHPAQRRLAFEELLANHLALKLRKRSLKSDAAWPLADGAVDEPGPRRLRLAHSHTATNTME